MNKKLCVSCSKKLRARYMGGKARTGTCENCGKRVVVTPFEVPEQDSELTEVQNTKVWAVHKAPEYTTITLMVDARTAVTLQKFAALWGCSLGAVVDSIVIHFLRFTKRGKKNT